MTAFGGIVGRGLCGVPDRSTFNHIEKTAVSNKKHPPGKGGDETRGADPDAAMIHFNAQQCRTLSTGNNISIKSICGKEEMKFCEYFFLF
jgi:hypothetical protein